MTRIQIWKARGIPGYLVCRIPGLASSFGFVPCSCGQTDGTVDCPHHTASEMIQDAADFLDNHLGNVIDDPGYLN